MKTYTQVGGQTYDASAVQPPPSGRAFRNAWTAPVDGVFQIDFDAAKIIKADRLAAEAEEDAKQAEKEARHEALKGAKGRAKAQSAAARAAKRRAGVRVEPVAAAKDLAALDALTVEDVAGDAT